MWRRASYVALAGVVALAILFCIRAYPYFAPPGVLVRVWHLTHRSSVQVGSYRVPVPSQWYAENPAPDITRIVDSRTMSWITVQSRTRQSFDTWHENIRRPPLAANVQVSGEEEIKAADVTWLCVGRTIENAPRYLFNAVCRTTPESSDEALEVSFSAMQPGTPLAQSFYPVLRMIARER